MKLDEDLAGRAFLVLSALTILLLLLSSIWDYYQKPFQLQPFVELAKNHGMLVEPSDAMLNHRSEHKAIPPIRFNDPQGVVYMRGTISAYLIDARTMSRSWFAPFSYRKYSEAMLIDGGASFPCYKTFLVDGRAERSNGNQRAYSAAESEIMIERGAESPIVASVKNPATARSARSAVRTADPTGHRVTVGSAVRTARGRPATMIKAPIVDSRAAEHIFFHELGHTWFAHYELSPDAEKNILSEVSRGDSVLSQGQIEAALKIYESTLTPCPALYLAKQRIALVNAIQGKRQVAIDLNLEALELYPLDLAAIASLVELYIADRNYPKAIRYSDALKSLHSYSADSHFWPGILAIYQGDLSLAREELKRASAMYKSDENPARIHADALVLGIAVISANENITGEIGALRDSCASNKNSIFYDRFCTQPTKLLLGVTAEEVEYYRPRRSADALGETN